MSLPIWDPIELPPDTVCVDINSIEPESLRVKLQADALEAYLLEIDAAPDSEVVRDWSDEEGIFAVYEDGEITGLVLLLEVEGA